MKLTILGSGTVVPNGDRNSSGYFVELPEAKLMMDCGAGSVHSLARYELPWERLSHLFITHFHIDHAGELGSVFSALRYGMKTDRNEPLTIVGPQGLDRVMEGLKLAFGSTLFDTKFPLALQMLSSGAKLDLGPDSFVSVMKTRHTPESLAIRIDSCGKSLGYTGDTAYDEELARFFQSADVLISECSFPEPRESMSHLSISEAARLARQSDASKLVLTHFYFDVDEHALNAEIAAAYAGEVIIGFDGYSIEI